MISINTLLKFVSLIAASLILSACAETSPTALPTSTPELPTPIPTATISWFPATNTRTPLPTQGATPTPAVLPGLGALLFSDNFSRADLWTATTSNAGNSIISNNRLTLTLAEGTDLVTITSLRMETALTDFYAVIDAQLSLCRGRDQFSLLFRVLSEADFYRFSVACSGEVRLERVVSGKPFVIRDWAPSPDAPLGAPGEVKLSVWADGRDLRFFLNDHFQFNVSDHILTQGGLGVYIHSDAGNPMSISFSNLAVSAVEPGLNTPTPQIVTPISTTPPGP
ncbi:MAG: hypothetical protein A2X25_06785 [Chloroflexi bacterium GWB2_49_20]|nr:MAG: hypothetical protein A2X25_06785 [Chloroflexi bacterium GWB2_49_20]OGN80256.1 MAG: hypothetical protein A2X26_07995 [Chloroflexi bacterium GWC2_49_37]OGN86104.1 MAG: hypothetical protein A2X27_00750 [Chloroflexi bacterium GWD2_49_16]HCM96370.1 hypothetical protein [Anaerolineae bacterium]